MRLSLRAQLPRLLLALLGSSAPGVAAAETVVFSNGFESGGYCSTWSDASNPETCNGIDDDCDGYIDELLVDCNVCAPPAAVDAALEGVQFDFCIPEQQVTQNLVSVAICSELQ